MIFKLTFRNATYYTLYVFKTPPRVWQMILTPCMLPFCFMACTGPTGADVPDDELMFDVEDSG